MKTFKLTMPRDNGGDSFTMTFNEVQDDYVEVLRVIRDALTGAGYESRLYKIEVVSTEQA